MNQTGSLYKADVEEIKQLMAIDSNNQQDNDFTPFLNIINEFFVRDTSKKIKAVMKNKGEAGEHLCTIPPYGFIKDPNNKKRWIVDAEAAEVVRRIFNLCLEGYGPSQIARILEADKVLTPSAHWQTKGVSCPARQTNTDRQDQYVFRPCSLR